MLEIIVIQELIQSDLCAFFFFLIVRKRNKKKQRCIDKALRVPKSFYCLTTLWNSLKCAKEHISLHSDSPRFFSLKNKKI